jgi:enoyl-CoA hydratase/carnithine racemase
MSQRLPRRVGTYRARELMLTCRTVGGREAAEIGLADYCVPDAEFDSRLEALAGQILANSWYSHRANKRLLVETDAMTVSQGLAHEIFRGAGRGPDMAERIAGFQNKTVKQA